MKSLKRVAVVTGLGLVGLSGADNVQAAGTLQDTDSFTITVEVQANCSMTVGADVLLTPYDYAAGNIGQTSVDVVCSTGAPWELQFDGGVRGNRTLLRGGGTVGTAGDELSYTLDSTVNGAVDASLTVASGTGNGTAVGDPPDTVDVEVIVGGGQGPADGTFTDSVTVDLYY